MPIVVLGGNTGPHGTYKAVNIITAFTGIKGERGFATQATGATGTPGLLKRVYNVGASGPVAGFKTIVIPGYAGPTGS